MSTAACPPAGSRAARGGLNWFSTVRPVVFSHSLTRGMRAAWQRSVNGVQKEGPVNAASTSPSSPSIASRYSGSSLRMLLISRSSAWRRCHSHRYSSAPGKRLPTAFVSPESLSHASRGGAPASAPRNASQSACDLVVNASRRHSFARSRSYPIAAKIRNATPVRPVAGSRTRNGRSSSSSDPLVGQACGR